MSYSMDDIKNLSSTERMAFYRQRDQNHAAKVAEVEKRSAVPKSKLEIELQQVELRASQRKRAGKSAGPFEDKAVELRQQIAAEKQLAANLETNKWYLDNLTEKRDLLKGHMTEAESQELDIAEAVFMKSASEQAGLKLVDSISKVIVSVNNRAREQEAQAQSEIATKQGEIDKAQAALDAERDSRVDLKDTDTEPQP